MAESSTHHLQTVARAVARGGRQQRQSPALFICELVPEQWQGEGGRQRWQSPALVICELLVDLAWVLARQQNKGSVIGRREGKWTSPDGSEGGGRQALYRIIDRG